MGEKKKQREGVNFPYPSELDKLNLFEACHLIKIIGKRLSNRSYKQAACNEGNYIL